MNAEAASYLKVMDSTQEELVASMEEEVARGNSVLDTFPARLYMDRVMGEQVVMSNHLPTMTWERLMGFTTLVAEYNLEWALASYDWSAE